MKLSHPADRYPKTKVNMEIALALIEEQGGVIEGTKGGASAAIRKLMPNPLIMPPQVLRRALSYLEEDGRIEISRLPGKNSQYWTQIKALDSASPIGRQTLADARTKEKSVMGKARPITPVTTQPRSQPKPQSRSSKPPQSQPYQGQAALIDALQRAADQIDLLETQVAELQKALEAAQTQLDEYQADHNSRSLSPTAQRLLRGDR